MRKVSAKKEPSDSPLFHSHNGLQGKFLLPAPQHVTVHKPDQKQKDQRDGADGHLHPVAKHREIIGTSDVGMIVTAGDGQEGIKQCDTDRHGHYIDQVIPDGPLGVSKKSALHTWLCPPPIIVRTCRIFSKNALLPSSPLTSSVKISRPEETECARRSWR